ncbi:unnamed protein product [Hermetia illucens]|uniref:RING-type E3 ubiquitin transferase n=2 Tax=Hermetia illucens TaxID=343691 RepID=A0A7R8V4F4_HERIL|nr:unnamed protein product [Hermetia illucens]
MSAKMDAAKIFTKVFREPIIENMRETESAEDYLIESIGRMNIWLEDKINGVNDGRPDQRQEHRVGPERVLLDVDRDITIKISKDKLCVQSHATFCTIKANVAVYNGKWMYEVQLRSKGVMQIGWCSNKCEFSTDTGVGDTKNSYGYDGSKQQIWHVYTTKYGESWQSGDIIGVCIDMEQSKIEFYKNGVSMGVAFSGFERGPGLVLYPAISLAYNESLVANFGNVPFQYPISGYQPLQMKPETQLDTTELLMGYLVNLSGIMSRQKTRQDKKENKGAKKSMYALIAAALIEKLSDHLLSPYVIADKFFHYVKNLCVLRSEADKDAVILPGSPESTLGTLLTLLWVHLDDSEMKFILKTFLNMLQNMFRQTSKDLEYEQQRRVIVVLTCLCNHPQTRKFYIDNKFFKDNCLPMLLYLKPPEYTQMISLLPDDSVWVKGVGGSKEKYSAACDKLNTSVKMLYNLQKNLLSVILNNDDGSTNEGSSRKIFLSRLRKYVMENSLEHRAFFLLQGNFTPPTESPVALSFLCILVDIAKSLFEKEISEEIAAVDPVYFVDGSFRYYHFDRIGGVLSHLRKIYRTEIVAQLGEDHDALYNIETTDLIRADNSDVYSAMFLISGNLNTFSIAGRAHGFGMERRQETRTLPITPGNSNSGRSLSELLDLAIIYYYSVGHKYVVKIAAIRDEIASLNDILSETTVHQQNVEKDLKNAVPGATLETLRTLNTKLVQRCDVFKKRLIELGRKQAWYRSVALGDYRRSLLIWLLDTVLATLKRSSLQGVLFAFLPEIYLNVLPILLDTVLDFSRHELVIQNDLSDSQHVIQEAAEFLALHSADPRVILAACKDSLLQALGSLTCHQAGIKALERSSNASQLSLVRALLRPYENRAWGQSNWLLLRFWLGDGFAYKEARPPCVWQGGNTVLSLGLHRSRAKNETHTGLLHHIAPAYPSKHFQQVVGKLLLENEPFSTLFLNSVLSQLNWAFSEFILLLQEIQNTSNRQEADIIFEPRQLKICSMCFELTVSLMRSLEMVISVAPNVFQDSSRQNSDLILNRVCQLVSQVLSRVTVPPGCFQYVIDLCLPDLSSVTHFAIVTAALGILLALLQPEMESEVTPVKVSRVTRSLLTDPSFQIANIEFALGEVKTPILTQKEVPRGNFDPKMRAHIDPLTNDVRVAVPSTSKRIRADPPIIKFSLRDYPDHVQGKEIKDVEKLVEMLLLKQSLLSDITLPSEDSLCPICCAKPVSVVFSPCKHQSCSNCILQHLMNSKVCFYCKSMIKDVTSFDGSVIFKNANYIASPEITE